MVSGWCRLWKSICDGARCVVACDLSVRSAEQRRPRPPWTGWPDVQTEMGPGREGGWMVLAA